MKMSKILALILALVMVVSCFAACGGGGTQGGGEGDGTQGGGSTNPLAGTYDITVWVSDIPFVADQFAAQIDAFEAANPGIVINATISTCPEGDAGGKVAADVKTAPDLYCFAQDQLANLVIAAALAPIKGDVATAIKNDNDAASVAAATYANTLYAYPLTSDNGYFMYYDTSIISEEDAKDLATILKRCEENSLYLNFEAENGYYIPAFFFGAGCVSEWTMDADGGYNGVNDNFNSEAGLKAMKALQVLTHSKAYNNSSNAFSDIGAIITGTWNANNAKDYFGDDLGVAKLPSVTVDGETFQLSSFHGFKLLGVKPQTDEKRGAVLQLLAQYLTGEECQSQRFDKFGWGPSNKVAAAKPEVLADPILGALYDQREHSVMQGLIHGSWWALAGNLAAIAKETDVTEVEKLQQALVDYEEAIKALITLTEEQKLEWSVIGNMYGDIKWTIDYVMTQVSDGVYESEPIEFVAGNEFKIRQGRDWKNNFGANGEFNSAVNCQVEQSGTFKVRFEYSGTGTTATITLIPVE